MVDAHQERTARSRAGRRAGGDPRGAHGALCRRRVGRRGRAPRGARDLDDLHTVKQNVRDARIGAGLDACRLDLRYSWRGLRNAPGFTAVVVATLALGIGANTTLFSVVRGLLLKPLPYRDPGQLVFVWLNRNQVGYSRGPMSGPDFRDLRARTRSFADIAGIWATGSVTLGGDGEPEQLRNAASPPGGR